MAADEEALRSAVEDTQAKVADLRAMWREKQTDATGKRLLKAREEASEALAALWAAFPQEKPPTQYVM